MSKILQAEGTYKVKDTGEEVKYSFDYTVIESVEDCVELLGEDKTKSLLQRMLKVDSNNLAREKAKAANGHSTRAALSEEEKQERKAKRGADRELLAVLKAKGLSLSDIENL